MGLEVDLLLKKEHPWSRFAGETTIDEIFGRLRANCPNVKSFWLKTSLYSRFCPIKRRN